MNRAEAGGTVRFTASAVRTLDGASSRRTLPGYFPVAGAVPRCAWKSPVRRATGRGSERQGVGQAVRLRRR